VPLTSPVLPYGLRDVKLTPLNSDGSLGTSVDLPAAQTLSFSESEEFEELRGDDRLIAVHGHGPIVEWDLEAGGISLEAWKVLTGGTLTDTGTTPNQTKSFKKLVTDARPYFRIEGRSVNDVDGDTHVLIYKAKVTDTLEGEFADGSFFVTKCSGQGLGNALDELYLIVWNQQPVNLTAGVNELQLIASDATGGTFTITYSAQTTAANAWNATATDIYNALVALSNIGPTDVLVTGGPGNWYVEFQGTLAATNVTKMTVTNTLTGGSASVITLRDGAPPV
jgi:hypothetical protein